ncbi:hypothetical protein GGR57DRAFT_320989 [Xylariaceae sp. FL1272]|nr:hypothetical protein GGR57DRAFT_320989 [Xylariaceae sp. FL1272]
MIWIVYLRLYIYYSVSSLVGMDTDKEVRRVDHGLLPIPDNTPPESLYPYHNHNYYSQYSQYLPGPPAERRIGGLRIATFWLLIILTAVVALAVGLGTGLGLGLQGNNNTQSSKDINTPQPATQLSSTQSTSSPSGQPSASKTSTTASTTSSTSPTSSPSSPCPSGNGTTIQEEAFDKSTLSYRIYCDSDLGGPSKLNLASAVTDSWDQCLAWCNSMNYFGNRTDIGLVFNQEGTGGQTAGTCWCESSDGFTVHANEGNHVAMPIGTTD